MTFEECEMAVLRSSIDSIDKKKGEEMISNPQIIKIITIVEKFLKNKSNPNINLIDVNKDKKNIDIDQIKKLI